MKIFKGTLHLLKSSRPPVFRPVTDVEYLVAPKKGQAFLFSEEGRLYSRCHTSTVQKVSKFDGFVVLKTLNSAYVLVHGADYEQA